MFWLILLIVVAALCALVLFLVAPAAGCKELRTPFAGRICPSRLFWQGSAPAGKQPARLCRRRANGYGMEMDVQFSSDRKLLVFHDDTLTRMTGTKGWVRDYPYDQICQMPLKGSAEHAPLFSEFCRQWTAKPR